MNTVTPFALVLAMTVAYGLCFSGMILAYVSYRRRRGPAEKADSRRKP